MYRNIPHMWSPPTFAIDKPIVPVPQQTSEIRK